MKKKIIWIVITITILGIALIWTANIEVENSTESFIYNDTSKIPYNKAGLLLGTSKYLKSGKRNQYFINRIKSAVDLYIAKKIDFIVISGDNSRNDYNEPLDMKKELILFGVPKDKIYLDYAGFRTYDSVIRMDKIFGQKKFTVISQDFHNRRAIFIAKSKGLNAIGFNAADVDAYSGFKTKLREKIARFFVFIDLAINREPKFLGQRIEIK